MTKKKTDLRVFLGPLNTTTVGSFFGDIKSAEREHAEKIAPSCMGIDLERMKNAHAFSFWEGAIWMLQHGTIISRDSTTTKNSHKKKNHKKKT